MRFDAAEYSLTGQRRDNEDRVAILRAEHAVMIVAIDGMGGHAEGARAAATALQALRAYFASAEWPVAEPRAFLEAALADANAAVVALGEGVPLDLRPRATCAVVLIQAGTAHWAHVGDSRVYWLRGGRVLERTRDHTHLERLHQRGFISEEEMHDHPLRHLVESCLGGEPGETETSVGTARRLEAGDVLLACTDGFWAGLEEPDFAALEAAPAAGWAEAVGALAEQTVTRGGVHADNASVAALRWWQP